jgi:microcin C transport system permease protein
MNKAETVKNRSWSKFRKHRRGMVSLCLLVFLYVVSLFVELLCNDKPIILKTEKGIFFPAYKTYTGLGFKMVGSAFMYGHNYKLLELLL